MKAQSALIAFLIALILILVILIPAYYLLLNYSKPSVKSPDFAEIAQNQINGGSVLIYFNSSPFNSQIIVFRGNSNFTLTGVFSIYYGKIVNITNYVTADSSHLPLPLVYNFSISSVSKYFWNTTLIIQLQAYNVTVFATLYPNETAIS
ncbi:hypothetical protein [Acidianus manzaensis]|uniref:Uncharacterized protein n=1 Tax=Acidianus manzaensis TaxID=282676 RepID=A0A1W6K2Y8_9CREN|nr:hypothetical protein [Acidianus manzaensis]ARM76822.1 hypothetical protein B6F84_12865 [Acidianus manzaensis]